MFELKEFYKAKHTHFFLKPVNDDLSHLRALIIGSEDTPFEGSFLYFDIKIPNDYPFSHPTFLFLTPNCKQRIHPNLYQSDGKLGGKVC